MSFVRTVNAILCQEKVAVILQTIHGLTTNVALMRTVGPAGNVQTTHAGAIAFAR